MEDEGGELCPSVSSASSNLLSEFGCTRGSSNPRPRLVQAPACTTSLCQTKNQAPIGAVPKSPHKSLFIGQASSLSRVRFGCPLRLPPKPKTVRHWPYLSAPFGAHCRSQLPGMAIFLI